jgi:phage terminase small subunit
MELIMPRPGSYGAVLPIEERVAPPANLKGPAKDLFCSIVLAAKPSHFLPVDVPLLASYCKAVIVERDAMEKIHGDISNATPAVMKVQRLAHTTMFRLSRSLRISPIGRHPTLSSTNDFKASTSMSYYDRMELEERNGR